MQCYLSVYFFLTCDKSYFAQAAGVNRPCQNCWPGLRRGFAAQAGPAPASPASSPSKRGVKITLFAKNCLACWLPSSGPLPAHVRASCNCAAPLVLIALTLKLSLSSALH